MLESMVTLEFKQKFDLPRINEYVASLTKFQETWFWNLVWEMKQVFPKMDIYHAGSAKYGYIGFGKKKLQAKRVEDFLFVLHLKKDKYGNCHFILYISDQAYKLIDIDEKVLPQGYDEELVKNKIRYRDWLETFKKVAIEAEINFEGQNLFPIDYEVEDYFSTVEAYDFLKQKYQKIKEATKKIVGFRNNANREMALILDNLRPSIFIGCDPENNKIFKFSFIDNNSKIYGRYDENEGRHDGLKSHSPSLYKGHKAYYIEINSLLDLEKFCEWYESVNLDQNFMNVKESNQHGYISEPLNQILSGPPGTGKTYATTELAVKIAVPEWYALLENNDEIDHHSKIKEKYDELIQKNQIAFTTFHQSFAYEDFIEGLKAYIPEDQDKIAYKVEDGVFKQIALAAEKSQGIIQKAVIGLNNSPKIWKISLGERWDTERRQRYFKNQQVRIGWSATGDLTEESGEKEREYIDTLKSNARSTLFDFSERMNIGDVVLCLKDQTSVQAIGIITSDYYFDRKASEEDEDFAHVRDVNWIVTGINFNILALNHNKNLTLKTVYELYRMSWSKIVDELKDQEIEVKGVTNLNVKESINLNYVLIMDEINRGNISKIFGELITLIEDDKRSGNSDARELTLPYSKDLFSVPANLYLIGTMNTADKSLTQLDLALRRRFEFKEILPNIDVLKSANQYGFNIVQMLQKINQRIQCLKGKDYQIGHAYFMPLCKQFNEEKMYIETLQRILRNKILPLLQEYFFSNLDYIGLVLNDNDESSCRIIEKNNTEELLFPFAEKLPKFNPLHSIRLNTECFESIDRIKQIYS